MIRFSARLGIRQQMDLQVEQAQGGDNLVFDDLVGVYCILIASGFSVFGREILCSEYVGLSACPLDCG